MNHLPVSLYLIMYIIKLCDCRLPSCLCSYLLFQRVPHSCSFPSLPHTLGGNARVFIVLHWLWC